MIPVAAVSRLRLNVWQIMRSESTPSLLAKCRLMYYRISECGSAAGPADISMWHLPRDVNSQVSNAADLQSLSEIILKKVELSASCKPRACAASLACWSSSDSGILRPLPLIARVTGVGATAGGGNFWSRIEQSCYCCQVSVKLRLQGTNVEGAHIHSRDCHKEN